MTATNRFTPKLGHDPAYMKDPDPRSEPIPYEFTPQERDANVIAVLDRIAMQRANNQFVPGIVATELSPEDLTDEERRSFNL